MIVLPATIFFFHCITQSRTIIFVFNYRRPHDERFLIKINKKKEFSSQSTVKIYIFFDMKKGEKEKNKNQIN